MKKALFLFLFLICGSAYLMAQEPTDKKIDALKGTYQVQIRGQLREPVSLPVNLADIILQKRDAEKVIYHTIVENKVRLMILPSKYILSSDYKPLGVQSIMHEFTNE